MSQKKFCKYCGAVIDQDSIICPECGRKLEGLNGSTPHIIIQSNTSSKSKIVALLLAIFLGELGIHRFYVGKVGTGILWLLTAGLCGIGWIYDIVKIATGTATDGAGMVMRN